MEDLAKQYIKTELKIKELNVQLKQLRVEKDECSDRLQEFMKQKNIEIISTGEYNILIKTTKQYCALNKEYLTNSLKQYFTNPLPKSADEFAEKTTEHLLNNREAEDKPGLKLKKLK